MIITTGKQLQRIWQRYVREKDRDKEPYILREFFSEYVKPVEIDMDENSFNETVEMMKGRIIAQREKFLLQGVLPAESIRLSLEMDEIGGEKK